jgi:hypothetical protein
MRWKSARSRATAVAWLVLLIPVGDAAQEAGADDSSELSQMRSDMAAMRQLVLELQRKVAEQDKELEEIRANQGVATTAGTPAAQPAAEPEAAKAPEQPELEKQLEQELAVTPESATPNTPAKEDAQATPATGPAAPITIAGGDRSYLRLSFDALVAGGGSSTSDVERLESGGHDPVQRGFTVQNVEMVVDGAVDPYLRGQGNVVFQLGKDGDTNVELEEAYLTTTSLPYNLQGKAGQFFTEFGRLNAQHPHSWDFVDQPLANGRFLGPDGLRGPGVRMSLLVPTPFYSELFLAAQNGDGETGYSFRNKPGEVQFGRPVLDRSLRNVDDLVFTPRYAASFDLSDTQTLVAGVSGAFGPNGTGMHTSTQIYGTDLFWKWKPSDAEAGFPFVKWQTEALYRDYEAGAASVDTGTGVLDLPAETLRDWGGYSQILWGFTRGWVVGMRGDYVHGDQNRFDPDPLTHGTHWRASPDLTWYPTEFSKFRLQFNHDYVQGFGSDESVWVQMEFLLGAHAAHQF